MYQWWVFVHLVGVFGFLAAHGVSMGVMLRLRTERDPRRVSELLELSAWSIRGFYAALGVLLVGGVAAAFVGHLWSERWIWTAIGILVVTSVAMTNMARPSTGASAWWPAPWQVGRTPSRRRSSTRSSGRRGP